MKTDKEIEEIIAARQANPEMDDPDVLYRHLSERLAAVLEAEKAATQNAANLPGRDSPRQSSTN